MAVGRYESYALQIVPPANAATTSLGINNILGPNICLILPGYRGSITSKTQYKM